MAPRSGSANGAAEASQLVHSRSIPTIRRARSAAMRFGASAVRKSELDTQLAAKAVHRR